MKKLVLFAAVALSMSFFACGNGEKAAENADSAAVDSVEAVEAVDTVAAADSVVADSVAAPADSAAEAK